MLLVTRKSYFLKHLEKIKKSFLYKMKYYMTKRIMCIYVFTKDAQISE